MTPRHIAMFCLTQLACLAGGILLAFKGRSLYAKFGEGWGEFLPPFPTKYELLINYGWMLIAIPFACVLLIPRHRDDESLDLSDWRPWGYVAAMLGMFVLLTPFLGVSALFLGFKGPETHIIYYSP